MRLIFVGGACVQKIGGDAVNTVPGSVEIPEPEETTGVPAHLIRLMGDVVSVRPLTQTEIDAESLRVEQHDIFQKIVLAFFNHENRIRVLESKQPVTRAQFISAIKAL